VQFFISSSASCVLCTAGINRKKKPFSDVTTHKVQDK
jgi:hypothetical protein